MMVKVEKSARRKTVKKIIASSPYLHNEQKWQQGNRFQK